MVNLSVAAKRILDNMKKSEGFLTLTQARSNRDAVSELLDELKIVSSSKDGMDGYKLLDLTIGNKKEENNWDVEQNSMFNDIIEEILDQ